MTDTLTLQFSSSTALTSKIIRMLTHSRFSHVDIVLPEGLLGASGPGKYSTYDDPGGVVIRPLNPWPYEIKRTVTIQTRHADAIIAAWRSQIGKPFDDAAIHAFLSVTALTTRNWDALDKWFCSEGIIWACREGGLFDYNLAVPMNKIDPNDCIIFLNPFLSPEDVDTLINGAPL